MPADQPEPVKAEPARRRRFRALRWFGVMVALLILGGGAALWVVTSSWFIIRQITPELERKLGGEVSIRHARYVSGGKVFFTDASLRVPGIAGPGGEIARIDEAMIETDLSHLFAGKVLVKDVELDGVRLRLSEDARNADFINFMGLKPDFSSKKPKPKTPPPRVKIRRASLEFGAHANGEFALRGRRRVVGEMDPAPDVPGWYTFELQEMNDAGEALGDAGLFIKGDWNALTNAWNTRIEGIELDERIYSMMPAEARLWWERMKPEGTVGAVEMSWLPEGALTVDLPVENVALTLPIDTDQLSRYRAGEYEPTASRPRMHVHSGKMRFARDRLELIDLQGELISSDPGPQMVAVPYQINLTVPALPDIDWTSAVEDTRVEDDGGTEGESWGAWMDRVLETTPFEMKFQISDFNMKAVEGEETPAIDLPTIVAKVLSKFRMTEWVLSSSITVSRQPPAAGPDGVLVPGAVLTQGQALINKATGQYHKFPYELRGVDAYLQFDNEKVIVHSLTGSGSGESTFRIMGEIAPPEKHAAVALKIKGSNIPLDDALRAALSGGKLQAFDALFHRPAFESLRAAGLIPDEAALERAERERDALVTTIDQERAANDGSATALARLASLEEKAAALDRFIAAGPFTLGGVVDVDLSLNRALGQGESHIISGTVDVQSVGLLYEKFPYPLRVVEARLDWQHDSVTLLAGPSSPGARFVTPGGGEGIATGSVAFPKEDGDRKVRPSLAVTIENDQLNNAAYATIPLTDEEGAGIGPQDPQWPGAVLAKAAKLVRGIGLSGGIDYHGDITTTADDRITFDFELAMENGVAAPTVELAEAVNFTKPLWPEGFALAQLSGKMRVSRDGVSWSDFTGRQGETLVTSTGAIDLRQDQHSTDVTVAFENMQVGEYVLNGLPEHSADGARALWDRFSPSGTFDATLEYRAAAGVGGGGGAGDFRVHLVPRAVALATAARPIQLSATGGRMTLHQGRMLFDALQLDMASRQDAGNRGGDRGDERGDELVSEGTLTLAGETSLSATGAQANVSGSWTNARFQSPVASEILRLAGGDALAERYRSLRPRGAFDADFRIASTAPPEEEGWNARPDYAVTVRPQQIAARVDGTPIEIDVSAGELRFTPGLIAIADLRGQYDKGLFEISGDVKTEPDLDVDLDIEYAGEMFSREVRAFIPAAAEAAIDAIKLKERKASTLTAGTLRIRAAGQAPDGSALFSTSLAGDVETQDVSFIAGMPFTGVDGRFTVALDAAPGAPLKLSIDAAADRAVVGGQPLRNLHAPIYLDETGTLLIVPEFRADAGEGAVTAMAQAGVGERTEYEVAMELVGVPLERFIMVAPPSERRSVAPLSERRSGSESRATGSRRDDRKPEGEIYASFTLSGARDDPSSRRGRGVVRILRGRITSVPILLHMMQMLQFTFPLAGSLNYAEAEAYLEGDRIVFERILFESNFGKTAALQLIGEGEMNSTTLELDTRFRSRSSVALIRDIVGGIGDALYLIEVSGPLRNPQVKLISPRKPEG